MRACWLVVLLAACGGGPAAELGASPELRDPGFGNGGLVRKGFCTTGANAQAVVATEGGGVVAAGHGCGGWVLAAYTPAGVPDPAFGTDGVVVVFPDAGSTYTYEVNQLLRRPDGRLIARGWAPNDFDSDWGVRQFSAKGELDLAFAAASDEVLKRHFRWPQALGVFPDESLVVGMGEKFGKLRPDGTLDPAFDVVFPKLLGPATFLLDLAPDPDGRIVVLGILPTEANRWGEPFVARLTAAGQPDATFGTKGVVKLMPGVFGTTQGKSLSVQNDGKVLVGGAIKPSELAHFRPAVWRLNANGTPDETFGAKGIAQSLPGGGDTVVQVVTALPDGKVLAGGALQATQQIGKSWQVSRFTARGELDESFGGSGTAAFDFGLAYSPGGVEALAVTAAGYVAAGRWFTQSGPTELALVRLKP